MAPLLGGMPRRRPAMDRRLPASGRCCPPLSRCWLAANRWNPAPRQCGAAMRAPVPLFFQPKTTQTLEVINMAYAKAIVDFSRYADGELQAPSKKIHDNLVANAATFP